MRFFLDTEFVNARGRIFLVSIGIVGADGRELYLENAEFDRFDLCDAWFRENVLGKLSGAGFSASRAEIADRVADFLLGPGPEPEIWAHYAAHDFVALCDLYGGMRALPAGMPRFCMDSKAAAVLAGTRLPSQTGTPNEHHALVDARWGKVALAALGVPFAAPDPERDHLLPDAEAGGPSP